jgi:hypothetical protein
VWAAWVKKGQTAPSGGGKSRRGGTAHSVSPGKQMLRPLPRSALAAAMTEAREALLHPQSSVLVLPDEAHCSRSGAEGLQFLCLVPLGEATKGQ